MAMDCVSFLANTLIFSTAETSFYSVPWQIQGYLLYKKVIPWLASMQRQQWLKTGGSKLWCMGQILYPLFPSSGWPALPIPPLSEATVTPVTVTPCHSHTQWHRTVTPTVPKCHRGQLLVVLPQLSTCCSRQCTQQAGSGWLCRHLGTVGVTVALLPSRTVSAGSLFTNARVSSLETA